MMTMTRRESGRRWLSTRTIARTMFALVAGGLLGLVQPEASEAPAASVVYADVASIFNDRCIVCHSGESPPKSLRLDTYKSVLAGSRNGPVVVAGDVKGSELLRRVRGESEPRMPLTGPPYLSDDEIRRLEQWVAAGMALGETTPSADQAPEQREIPAGQSPGAVKPPEAPPTTSEQKGAAGKPRADAPKKKMVTYSDVRSLLLRRCVKCHTARGIMRRPPEGLMLNTYDNTLFSSERAVIVPGWPEASELLRRVRGLSRPRMPYDGTPPLSEQEIRLLTQWVAQGARDADGKPAPAPVGAEVRYNGRLTGQWAVDDLPLVVTSSTRIRDVAIGRRVEVRGVVGPKGRIIATRIRGRSH